MSNDFSSLVSYFEKIESILLTNNALLQDLIQILAPVFPREASSSLINKDIEKAIEEGKLIFDFNCVIPSS